MGRILPILMVVIALGAGAGAGVFLGGGEACAAGGGGSKSKAASKCPDADGKMPETASEFAALKRQFVIPVMQDGIVTAMVVASLALEVTEGSSEATFSAEPKLRDAFLQVLFVHAHSGGFSGAFTSGQAIDDLRERLREVAVPVLGDMLKKVLITDIVRQDL